jgi:hypothetical protein
VTAGFHMQRNDDEHDLYASTTVIRSNRLGSIQDLV